MVDLEGQDLQRAKLNAILSSFPLPIEAIAAYNNSVNQACVVEAPSSANSMADALRSLVPLLPSSEDAFEPKVLTWIFASTQRATKQSVQLLQALLHEISAVPNLEINRRLQQQVPFGLCMHAVTCPDLISVAPGSAGRLSS
jgi:hypothetical protein